MDHLHTDPSYLRVPVFVAAGAAAPHAVMQFYVSGAALMSMYTTLGLNSTVALTANIPYLLIYSYSGSTANLLAKRLDTGAITTHLNASLPGAAPVASDGTYTIGSNAQDTSNATFNLAALLYSKAYLPGSQLVSLAAYRWGPWRPQGLATEAMVPGGGAMARVMVMACISSHFPSSPVIGQIFTAPNNVWQWDGVKWPAVGSSVVEPTPPLPPTGAPTGAPQHPTLFARYNQRPPWAVAGVDYRVGIQTGTVLTDWQALAPSGGAAINDLEPSMCRLASALTW